MTIVRDILNRISANGEKKRLRRSLNETFFDGTGRDAFQFYENGRSVTIYAEMMLGSVERRIHRQTLTWNDSGEPLGEAKQTEVVTAFCQYLDRRAIKWEVFGG
jgi:hypothetical protein